MRRLILILPMILLLMATAVQAQDNRPSEYRLDLNRLRHEYQGWNNCGPTTLTMGLSYYGYTEDQFPAANYLKPHREDKNVSPWEMVQYVNTSTDISALYRPGGNLELVRTLLAADFPVVVEKGFEPDEEDGWMGHYLLLIGYNDTEGYFYTYDSYLGHGDFQGLHEPYNRMVDYWWHFSNTFIVLYPPERETELLQLLGDLADMNAAYQSVALTAQASLQTDPDDAWSWFNVGDALTMLGQYEQATNFFEVAITKGLPWRTLWYRHTPFEAFYQAGRFEMVLELTEINLANTSYVEEWYYYQALVWASRGDTDEARRLLQVALQYNSRHEPSRAALTALDNGTFSVVPELVQ